MRDADVYLPIACHISDSNALVSQSTSLSAPMAVQNEIASKTQFKRAPTVGAFSEFWSTWPDSQRKTGASYCRRYWQRHDLENESENIIRHLATVIVASSRATNNGGAPLIAPIVYLQSNAWRQPCPSHP